MSDIKQQQQSTGVIVKHDTNSKSQQSPLQIIHTSKSSQPSTNYSKSITGATQPGAIPMPGQYPQIFEYRQSQMTSSAHDRYKASLTSMPNSGPYAPTSQQQIQHQQHQQQQAQQMHYSSVQKPKVPSPAPPRFYGKPSGAGIVSGIPVCRAPDIPIYVTKSSSPSLFQSQQVYVQPPPAHSSRSHDYRMHQQPSSVKQPLPHPMHGTSPPTASAAPSPMARSPGIMPIIPSPHSGLQISQSFQTQPLDLGVTSSDRSRDDSSSPKRKGTPIHHPAGSPVPLDIKRKRIESPIIAQNSPLALNVCMNERVSSPMIAGQTTITPVVDLQIIKTPKIFPEIISEVIPAKSPNDLNLNIGTNPIRTSSADGTVKSSSTNSSPSPSPGLLQSSNPVTPAKFQSEPEKSLSPGKFFLILFLFNTFFN